MNAAIVCSGGNTTSTAFPRFFVYLWIPVEANWLPGSIDIVVWIFTALLAIKMLSGFLRIRKNLKAD